MFVIPCKYSPKSPHIVNLVESIRKYHPTDKITIVDSGSADKSYFSELEKHKVNILDINNKNWMVGAYWHGYFNSPNEDFYYFLHDSTIVKGDLHYLQKDKLTILASFNRTGHTSFNAWNSRINTETKYTVTNNGYGVYGPMFMCSNDLITSLYNNNAHVLLPSNKDETGFMEGAFGAMFECEGYDMMKCALYGDILSQESPGGRSYPYPFNTSWQYPIEKFYASHRDSERLA